MKNLTPEERLIVAADFKPDDSSILYRDTAEWIKEKILTLSYSLKDTGVYIKINSGLRILGYEIIPKLHKYGLKVFADLKLNDISETLKIDGLLLKKYEPDILTLMCSTGVASMKTIKEVLPETEVLGVTVLTSLGDQECKDIYNDSVESSVLRLANIAKTAGIGGLVASPKEAGVLKNIVAGTMMSINTPGIRPTWAIVKGDDQSRIMTPYDAIMAGADRIVVGRPITTAENPKEAVERTLEEIKKACKEKEK